MTFYVIWLGFYALDWESNLELSQRSQYLLLNGGQIITFVNWRRFHVFMMKYRA